MAGKEAACTDLYIPKSGQTLETVLEITVGRLYTCSNQRLWGSSWNLPSALPSEFGSPGLANPHSPHLYEQD